MKHPTLYENRIVDAGAAVQRKEDRGRAFLSGVSSPGSYDQQAEALRPEGKLSASMSPREVAERGFSGSSGPIPYRAEMEQSFGRNFANVQAHMGAQPAEASMALNARAYTVGNRVGFKEASPDRAVVAHELAHTIQQERGGEGIQASGSGCSDVCEREADCAAEATVRGERAVVQQQAPQTVQCWGEPDHYAMGNLAGKLALDRFTSEFPGANLKDIRTRSERIESPRAGGRGIKRGTGKTIELETSDETSISLGAGTRYAGDYAKTHEGLKDQNNEFDMTGGPFGTGDTAHSRLIGLTAENHFYPLNQLEYAAQHQKALEMAPKNLKEALLMEAFALHFLQDSFAAGHFTPRALDRIAHGAVRGGGADYIKRCGHYHDYFNMLPSGLPTDKGRFHGDFNMDGRDLNIVGKACAASVFEVMAAAHGKPRNTGVNRQLPNPDLAAILNDPLAGPVWEQMVKKTYTDLTSYREYYDGIDDDEMKEKRETAGGTQYTVNQIDQKLRKMGFSDVYLEGAKEKNAKKRVAEDRGPNGVWKDLKTQLFMKRAQERARTHWQSARKMLLHKKGFNVHTKTDAWGKTKSRKEQQDADYQYSAYDLQDEFALFSQFQSSAGTYLEKAVWNMNELRSILNQFKPEVLGGSYAMLKQRLEKAITQDRPEAESLLRKANYLFAAAKEDDTKNHIMVIVADSL